MSNLSGVWSERENPSAPGGKLTDCVHCAVLMALTYAEAPIPNAFTVAERERFEDATGLPEFDPSDGVQPGQEQETGLLDFAPTDTASQALYGVQAHPPTEADLPNLLRSPKVAVALNGEGTGLPGGFLGAHAVCVVTNPAGGDLLVYDPLEPMGSGDVHASIEAIVNWHRGIAPYQDMRYTRDGEFAEPSQEVPVVILKELFPRGELPFSIGPDPVPIPGYDLNEATGQLTQVCTVGFPDAASSAPGDARISVDALSFVRVTKGAFPDRGGPLVPWDKVRFPDDPLALPPAGTDLDDAWAAGNLEGRRNYRTDLIALLPEA